MLTDIIMTLRYDKVTLLVFLSLARAVDEGIPQEITKSSHVYNKDPRNPNHVYDYDYDYDYEMLLLRHKEIQYNMS